MIPKPDESSHVPVLKWNHASDNLVVSRGTDPDTSKNIYSASGSELSFSSLRSNWTRCFLHCPRSLLLEDIWRLSQQWDDDRPHEIVNSNEWSKELPNLSAIIKSHSDSSHEVFSAVAFLRGKLATTTGHNKQLAFVFGKAIVEPMKPSQSRSSSDKSH